MRKRVGIIRSIKPLAGALAVVLALQGAPVAAIAEAAGEAGSPGAADATAGGAKADGGEQDVAGSDTTTKDAAAGESGEAAETSETGGTSDKDEGTAGESGKADSGASGEEKPAEGKEATDGKDDAGSKSEGSESSSKGGKQGSGTSAGTDKTSTQTKDDTGKADAQKKDAQDAAAQKDSGLKDGKLVADEAWHDLALKAGSADEFELVVSKTGFVTLWLDAANKDLALKLTNATGAVTYAWVGRSGETSKTDAQQAGDPVSATVLLAPGTYAVRAGAKDALAKATTSADKGKRASTSAKSAGEKYRIKASFLSAGATVDDAGSTHDSAVKLASGKKVVGAIVETGKGNDGDVDVYAIEVPKAALVRVQASASSWAGGAGARMRVLDSSKDEVANKKIAADGEEHAFVFAADKGTYYVQVQADEAGDDADFHATGTYALNWSFGSADMADAKVAAIKDKTFTGKAIEPEVVVSIDGATLEQGTDYTVEYENNVNVGTASVVVTGAGVYKGSAKGSFRIVARDISGIEVAAPQDQVYDGKAKTPAVKVAVDGAALVAGKDYELTYAHNVNAGTATVSIEGKGNYRGTKTVKFAIAKAFQSITANGLVVPMGRVASLGAWCDAGTQLHYRSADPGIVQVSAAGVVTPMSVGLASVYVTAPETDNFKATSKTVQVRVEPGAQAIVASDLSVAVGDAVTLDAQAMGNTRLSFESSNPKVASVSSQGVVMGHEVGSAQITITAEATRNWNASSATVIVEVREPNSLRMRARMPLHTVSLSTLEEDGDHTVTSAVRASDAVGALTFENVSAGTVSRTFEVDRSTGDIVVPQDTPAGKYLVKVCAKAAGDADHLAAEQTVAFVVRVR